MSLDCFEPRKVEVIFKPISIVFRWKYQYSSDNVKLGKFCTTCQKSCQWSFSGSPTVMSYIHWWRRR